MDGLGLFGLWSESYHVLICYMFLCYNIIIIILGARFCSNTLE